MSNAQSASQESVRPSSPVERSLTRTLVLLIAVPGLLLLLAWVGLMVWSRSQVRNAPFGTAIQASAQGGMSATTRTYCLCLHGVTDVGDVRIAVFGLVFGGYSSGSVYISPQPDVTCSSSGGVGNRRFTESTAGGRTTCTFGGFTFTIEDSVISFADREVKLGEGPKVVFVRRDGTVESVEVVRP